MNILIVRHAIALERKDFAKENDNDEQRPLTEKGIERMEEGAKGLAMIAPKIDLLAHSPLVRAEQSAQILHRVAKFPKPKEMLELAPGYGPTALTDWFARKPKDHNLCLVGHEPDLSELVAWLTAGRAEGFVELKKGAACLLATENNKKAERAKCQLLWCISPRQLRLLGKATELVD